MLSEGRIVQSSIAGYFGTAIAMAGAPCYSWEYHVSYQSACPQEDRFHELVWYPCSENQNQTFSYIWYSRVNQQGIADAVQFHGHWPTYALIFQRGHYTNAKYVFNGIEPLCFGFGKCIIYYYYFYLVCSFQAFQVFVKSLLLKKSNANQYICIYLQYTNFKFVTLQGLQQNHL